MQKHSFILVTLFNYLCSVLAANVQVSNLKLPSSAAAHKAATDELLTRSWYHYKNTAFGHDDLSPISNGNSDPLGGWGASIVDAMGTLFIAGHTSLFEECLDYVEKLSFSTDPTGAGVSVFETTIRFVGGFLSAYELSGKKYPILVQKAKEVADKLLYGYEGSNPIPYNTINFTSNAPVVQNTNIAQAGTLSLEYNRLTKYTGNSTYQSKAEQSVQHIINLVAPFAGLPAQGLSPTTGESVGDYVTWGDGSDSYFEYLIKYARLTSTEDQTYADAWYTAVDSSIKHLKRTSTVRGWTYLGDHTDGSLLHVASHLECFHGGNWILGGRMLNNHTIFNYGLQLADACWNTYASTSTKIGPQVFYFKSSDGTYTGGDPPTSSQNEFYDKHGFYIASTDYILRPEVLETNFYAWRATGNTTYLDRAASALAAFQTFLEVDGGYAGLNNVNCKACSKINDMPSFWFAEVLKYLYLTFDDPSHISLNDYVFNTEAHPFKAPVAKSAYGSSTLMTSTKTFQKNAGKRPAASAIPSLPTQVSDVLGLDTLVNSSVRKRVNHQHRTIHW